MKLIYMTKSFANRVSITSGYDSQTIFFAGKQPPLDTLITLDLPGCKHDSGAALRTWIADNTPADIAAQKRGNLIDIARRIITRERPPDKPLEFPEGCWRVSVLDDLMTVSNPQMAAYGGVVNQFGLAELRAFCEHALPDLQRRLDAADAVKEPDARSMAIRIELDFASRLASVIKLMPDMLSADARRILLSIKSAEFAALQSQTTLDLQAWVGFLESVSHSDLFPKAATAFGARIASIGDSASIQTTLIQIHELIDGTRGFMNDERFWLQFAHLLKLEPTITSGTIDITNATERRVEPSFEVLLAERVGPVRIGRTALECIDINKGLIYIAGERKLKFAVERAGGKLRKYGVKLTTSTKGHRVVHKALLDVEMLDTLAQLDPPQALARLDDLNLPTTHPVRATAQQALDSVPHRRVLADMLIELRTGLDPEIARRMARAQAAGNRR